jgi:phospholipid transport system substrate-binding protein
MSKLLQRRAVLQLAMVGLLASPVAAYAQSMPGSALPAPAQPIQALNDALVSVMKAGSSAPFSQRYAMLAPVVDRTFDLNRILQLSVGLSWSSLPAARQAQLEAAFRRYTVATYIANFDSYSGQRFEISPTLRQVGNGEVIVDSKLVPGNGGSPTAIDFVMRQGAAGWQVVDVLLDGSISRVAVQRSDFSGLLSDGTGAALIASLQRKTASLSGGAVV